MPISQSNGYQMRISSPFHNQQGNILREVNRNMDCKFSRKDNEVKFIEINSHPFLNMPQSKPNSSHSTLTASVDPSLIEGW